MPIRPSYQTGPDRITCQLLMHASVSTQPQARSRARCQPLAMVLFDSAFARSRARRIVSTPRKMRRILQTVQHLAATRQLEAWERDRVIESEERIDGLHQAHLIDWVQNHAPVSYGPQYCGCCKMWLANSQQMESHCLGKKHKKNQRRALETAPWRALGLHDSV